MLEFDDIWGVDCLLEPDMPDRPFALSTLPLDGFLEECLTLSTLLLDGFLEECLIFG
jgi:hypothetical protein